MLKTSIGLVLILFIGLASWFFFFRGEPDQKITKDGPIIFFGDSLTAESGAEEGSGFPSLVTKELNLKNVINAGVGGDTSRTALNRLQADVLDKAPSIVVVELSGNDFLRGISTEETIADLESITAQIRKTGASVLLVHIRFPRKDAEYKAGFQQIAKKHQARVVWNVLDGIVGDPSLMANAIHPNAAGYQIMAGRIAEVFREML